MGQRTKSSRGDLGRDAEAALHTGGAAVAAESGDDRGLKDREGQKRGYAGNRVSLGERRRETRRTMAEGNKLRRGPAATRVEDKDATTNTRQRVAAIALVLLAAVGRRGRGEDAADRTTTTDESASRARGVGELNDGRHTFLTQLVDDEWLANFNLPIVQFPISLVYVGRFVPILHLTTSSSRV